MRPAEPAAGWRPTLALTTTIASAAGLLFLAIALHRRDLFALAAPLLAAVVVNAAFRPAGRVDAHLDVDPTTLLEDQAGALTVTLDSDAPLDVVTSSVRTGPHLQAGAPPVRCGAGREVAVRHRLRARRWGRSEAGPVTLTLSAWQGFLRREIVTAPVRVRVLPLREQFTAVDAVPVATGVIGTHRSRRPGEGGDLAGVRPFAPGDRLKRINWPVSLRSQQLHVTATVSDRDTAVMLVIDTSMDVRAATSDDGARGSLDTAVRAAASIAEHYLRAGDRVGLVDHARPLRPIRPSAGKAHLNRILDVLVHVTPQPMLDAAHGRLARAIPMPSMVVLLSPLIGAATRDRAVAIARAGHTVLIVDTLPEHIDDARSATWTDLARRLQQLQREGDIARLTERGIPVVAWRGPRSLDDVLRNLSRARRAPRVRA
ncbi:MAG TPA: DUF58 domain-containing protein [Jatrophihabitans sp.]|jgi:uncharacterized protein (DUF58 family)|uniref:DUF58 domain-containing protein n=1 Tax=Jatrophihabitans sp. TaxID=1932789 RepID=UPI002E000E9C|nr:DUF58 domain-containing protein [Jatrophihabitans sp.]